TVMNSLWQDLRYGARMLMKNPGFTLIAVLTLALGIGANTAIFTVLNAVLLRTLPAKDPQQLVFLSDPDSHGVHGGQETGDRELFAYHEFEWLRDHNQVFSGIFAADSRGAKQSVAVEGVRQGGEAEPASISLVSGAYFSVLGKGALLGRTFTEEVDRMKGACPVAVISYSFWERRLARDPSAIGRKVRIGQTSFDIIGVMPPGFFGETVGYAPNIWVPLTMQSAVYRGMDLLAPPQSVANKYMWLQVM